MKPVNSAAYKSAVFQFSVFFSLLAIVTALSIIFTLKTATFGVDVLEQKHKSYVSVFVQQSKISNNLDQLIRYLFQLKNKDRTSSQHKKLQIMISELKDKIKLDIEKNNASTINLALQNTALPQQLNRVRQLTERVDNLTSKEDIYLEMLSVVNAIQKNLDEIKKNQEDHVYQSMLLDKCINRYTRSLN